MKDAAWLRILASARRLSAEFPDAVFIGGVAVAQYARRDMPRLVEASHDADFYLSLTGKAQMRDAYEVIANPRLGKDSVTIDGQDFDIYVERQHALAIPYDQVAAHAQVIDGIRVAALEHLLILKLDALADRKASAKGAKDLRDLATIIVLLKKPNGMLLAVHLNARRLALLQDLRRRADIFRGKGVNQHEASRLFAALEANLHLIARAHRKNNRGLSR